MPGGAGASGGEGQRGLGRRRAGGWPRLTSGGRLRGRPDAMASVEQLKSYCWPLRLARRQTDRRSGSLFRNSGPCCARPDPSPPIRSSRRLETGRQSSLPGTSQGDRLPPPRSWGGCLSPFPFSFPAADYGEDSSLERAARATSRTSGSASVLAARSRPERASIAPMRPRAITERRRVRGS